MSEPSSNIAGPFLQREAEALALLHHPNIVRMNKPWSLDSKFFLEVETAEGVTLKEWVAAHPPVWIEPHLYILAQVARALGAVHEQQILHCNLKPENILISPEGAAKLTGFVSAGAEATFASDIFSFGSTAYEVLAGRTPFANGGGLEPLTALNPRVPAKIARLIESCLRENPADRPNSIWMVEAGLMDFLQMSGQMMRVKQWMKTGDPGLFSAALELKYSILKNDIQLEIERGTERAAILAKIDQFQALFPGDPALETLMSAITRTKNKASARRRIALVFAMLLLVLGIAAYFMAVKPRVTPPANLQDDDAKTEAVPMANPPPIEAVIPKNN